MQTMPATVLPARARRGRTRPRRAGPAALLASLALASAGCAGAAGPARAGASDTQGAASAGDQISVNKGGTAPAGAGKQTVGGFTAEFARCMRSHGVPRFPDPTGQPGQLGPASGVDLTAPRFVAALNGPCRSLAPPAWVDSGPGSVAGGGQ